MTFEFATSQRIIFGSGKLKELPEHAKDLGNKPAFITGKNAERIMPVFKLLQQNDIQPAAFSISGEPTIDRIETLVKQARKLGCDYVIAYGGGSVIDAGKAIAALLTNTEDIMNYLEVIGKGKPLTEDPAPCIAIPTTAGTGAEVTRNAVLTSTEHQVKISMRHPKMLPTLALVDPEQTLSMPPETTASTGLDAFIQLLEAFISKKSNPLTDAFCREGLKRASRSLYKAYTNGNDLNARTDMAFASLCGGLALANAGLGAVHGFAGPIGGMFNAPHGIACASTLLATIQTNHNAAKRLAPNHPCLKRLEEVAQILVNSNKATIQDGIDHLTNMLTQMFIPGLSELGITVQDIPEIVEKAKNSSSMKGNPVELSNEELSAILFESLHAPIEGDQTLYM